MRGRSGLLLLALLAGPASAGIYSYVDADGNRVFTDRPAGNAAEAVELRPANRMPAAPVTPREPPPAKINEARARYQAVRILTPAPDETIRNNAGELSVSGASEPALRPGHRYRLLLDGQPHGEPGLSPLFSLGNLDRGTHRIALLILDGDGQELARSAEQGFHMLRTSLIQRRRIHPCRRDDYGVRPECPLADKPKEKRDIPFVPYL